jgi:hypothetical protein
MTAAIFFFFFFNSFDFFFFLSFTWLTAGCYLLLDEIFPLRTERATKTKTVAYCKRLHYIYELKFREKKKMEREAREISVGTRPWNQHVCINRDRTRDDDGRRQRLKCEININPSSSAIWHHINRWGKKENQLNGFQIFFFLLLLSSVYVTYEISV